MKIYWCCSGEFGEHDAECINNPESSAYRKAAYEAATRVLDKVDTSIAQYQSDARKAEALGLIEYVIDVEGYVAEPTQKYLNFMDEFENE